MSENVEYIEKQTVRKIVEEWVPDKDDYDTYCDYDVSFNLWDGCCCAITAAPAADVAPVVYGHWIKQTVSSGRDSWQCSICGRKARGKRENLPYCHCGAKMDESEGEK